MDINPERAAFKTSLVLTSNTEGVYYRTHDVDDTVIGIFLDPRLSAITLVSYYVYYALGRAQIERMTSIHDLESWTRG